MDRKRSKQGPEGGTFGLIFLLGLVMLVTFAIGSGNNGIAEICGGVFIGGAITMYFAPSIIAAWFGHPDAAAIALLNLFLGWSLLGWVIALIWVYRFPQPADAATSVGDEDMKTCPFCDEPIRKQAIKCKHCGSAIEMATT